MGDLKKIHVFASPSYAFFEMTPGRKVDDNKLEVRRTRNRRSAQESRERKRMYTAHIELINQELSFENHTLKERLYRLEQDHNDILHKYSEILRLLNTPQNTTLAAQKFRLPNSQPDSSCNCELEDISVENNSPPLYPPVYLPNKESIENHFFSSVVPASEVLNSQPAHDYLLYDSTSIENSFDEISTTFATNHRRRSSLSAKIWDIFKS